MLDKRSPLFAQTHRFVTVFPARLLRHDEEMGLSTLYFAGGELRVPMVESAVGTAIEVEIDARDVSIALSRPMDVSILNRLPGEITELEVLPPPFARATLSLGDASLYALVTRESVERLALVEGLRAWAMIKTVAINGRLLDPETAPRPRRWPSPERTSSRSR
ncbi:MAG: molybdenum ABC transporter ATP-binding protein [Methylocystaceae bacterium]|nr:MAG: molybdenum ABC transporter ATP-binding protein [Methylocystaceae bacterium]